MFYIITTTYKKPYWNSWGDLRVLDFERNCSPTGVRLYFLTYLPNDRNGEARHWRYTCSPFLHFHDTLPSHSMFFSSFLVIWSMSPSWWNTASGLFITSSEEYPRIVEPDLFMYCKDKYQFKVMVCMVNSLKVQKIKLMSHHILCLS